MTERKLLDVDNMVLNLFIEPCDILRIGKVVVSSMIEGDGEAEILQVILWRLTLVVQFHVRFFAVVKAAELGLAALGSIELTVVLEAEGSRVGRQV